MSSPIPQAAIDAAAEAMWERRRRPGIEPGWPDLEHAIKQEWWHKDARAALEAALPHIWAQIDVDELAEVIADHDSLGYLADTGGRECECGELVAGADDDHPYQNWRFHVAQAVIAHLTGKDAK